VDEPIAVEQTKLPLTVLWPIWMLGKEWLGKIKGKGWLWHTSTIEVLI
jgi:hypothetical protein